MSCLFSNDKIPNKEVLLSIGNILKSCQKRWVYFILSHSLLNFSPFSPEATSVDIVLNILSDYYKSCDHPADARIAVLELIEQVGVTCCA